MNTSVRISAKHPPENGDVPAWGEFFTRALGPVDIEVQPGVPFDAQATLLDAPGLRVMWCQTSAQIRLASKSRTRAESDAFALIANLGGDIAVSQNGDVVSLGPGEAVALFYGTSGSITLCEADCACVVGSRALLTRIAGGLGPLMVRKIRRGNEPLEHLIRNLRSLRDVSEIHSPEVRHLVVAHVYDLIGMALGANRVDVYGLRAARLNAVKADILENLCSRDLTVRAVASRQHVSPRYIHMLFATEGQTFSEFVLAERLVHAHRMLSDPRHSCKSISAIAFEAGFGDLSYFDRTFRRRFGETPSKVRQGKRALDSHEVQNSAPPPVYPGGGK